MSAYELVTRRLAEVTGYQPARPGLLWTCPAHDDRTPSLSVTSGVGKVLVSCHAGCALGAVLERLNLGVRDLFDSEVASSNGHRKPGIVAEYSYTDENGALLYQVVRFVPKSFRQRAPDGHGGWTWSLNGVRRVVYRLPDVRRAIEAGEPVFVAEGEKDADALVRAGVVATCNPGGAGKWRSEYTDSLAGAAQVVVVADKDKAGWAHAREVARALAGHALEVIVAEALEGKDPSDHLSAGHTVEEFAVLTAEMLDELCADGAPETEEPAGVVHMKTGDRFVLDDPAELAPVWGKGDDVLWASGEPFLVVGPTGVGKTTLALLVLAGLLGIVDEVLGWPVAPSERPVLYLALDRPNQIRRAMRRLFGERHRALLNERLVVWQGPLPADLGKQPGTLMTLCEQAKAGNVFVDSLKDAVIKLTDDEAAGNYNRAVQTCVTAGVEVLATHHQRKGQGGAKPTTLEDVYGSTWITAGAGSVVLLWGGAGDPIVELKHLKQPAGQLGPLKVEFDHLGGHASVFRGVVDPLKVLRSHSASGLDATALAKLMFETERPNDNERKKAQRQLERLVASGQAVRSAFSRGGEGGSAAARYYLAEPRLTVVPNVE